MDCGLGGEPAEEHRKRALEVGYSITLGIQMVQVSALGGEGPSSLQAGLVGSRGFICLTLMNKWQPQPLFIYF